MKKLVSALLVAVLLAGMLPVVAPAVAEDSYAVVNSGNEYGVRLRLGPGTTYDIMNTLPSGTTVTILENGTVWSRIQAGTQVGYMMSKFLVTGGTTSSFTVESTATVYAGNGLRTWCALLPTASALVCTATVPPSALFPRAKPGPRS